MADETGSVFFPLPSEEPKAQAPASTPSSDQPTQPQSGALFVPTEQFEGRLQNVSDPEDQRKSAISGIVEGTYRLPAGIMNLAGAAKDEAAYLFYKGLEKTGAIPSADEMYANYELGKEQTQLPQIPEHVKEKVASDWERLKTDVNDPEFYKKLSLPQKAAMNIAKPIVSTIDTIGYEPKTYAGALAKEAAAGGTELVVYPIFGAGGAFGRFVAGALSGLAGEAGRQSFEGTPLEPWMQFLGAASGQMLGEGATKVAGSFAKGFKTWGAEKELNSALTEALQYDLKNNLTKIPPDELQAKLRSGEPINVGEVLSPESKTFAVLQDLAGNVPGKKSNEMVAQRLLDMSDSKIVNYGQLENSLTQAAKEEADRVFDIARANPNANDITFKDIGPWINNPKIQSIIKEVADLETLPTKDVGRKISAPSIEPGKPAIPARSEPTGLLDEFGNPIMREVPGSAEIPEKFIGGNLTFWQKVKERLGKEYGKTGEVAFLDAKDNLVSALSNKVPEYGEALAKTFERYGDVDAANAGYNLMKNIGTKKSEDYLGLMEKMNPNQLQNFRDGIVAALYEKAGEAGGIRYLASQINAPSSKFSYKLEQALGKEEYNKIAGSIIQQNMINDATTGYEKFLKLGAKVWEQKGYSAAALSAAAAAWGYMSGADIDQNKAIVGLGALLAGRQFAMNSLEKKIAPLALDAIRSPDGGRRLIELVEKNPEARTLLDKMSAATLRAVLAGGRSSALSGQESPEPLQSYGMPSPNAHGGRIAYKSGGRVKNARAVAESLLREIDLTRKQIGKKTEDILSMPDDAVATALKIARGNV